MANNHSAGAICADRQRVVRAQSLTVTMSGLFDGGRWKSWHMILGVSYPTTEVAANPDAIREFGGADEDLGYTHIMAYGHVVKAPHEGREAKLAGPYTNEHSFHDPFVLFGFAATLTDKLDFVTGVLVLAQRQTALCGVPRATVHADLAELAGVDALVNRGRKHVESGKSLEAIHLLDIVLGAEPANRDTLAVKKSSLEHLLVASANTNLHETLWFKSEISSVEAALI